MHVTPTLYSNVQLKQESTEDLCLSEVRLRRTRLSQQQSITILTIRRWQRFLRNRSQRCSSTSSTSRWQRPQSLRQSLLKVRHCIHAVLRSHFVVQRVDLFSKRNLQPLDLLNDVALADILSELNLARIIISICAWCIILHHFLRSRASARTVARHVVDVDDRRRYYI